MPFLIAIAAIMLWAGEAKAGCTCQCVDGRMQPPCSSTLDIAPPCMGICPLTMPGIAPLDDLSLPRLGTVLWPMQTSVMERAPGPNGGSFQCDATS
jgi:hypothetical protein